MPTPNALDRIINGRRVPELISVRTVTIANSATDSEEVYIGDGTLVGLSTDSAWDTYDINFKNSSTSGGTFLSVYDAANALVKITSATASRYYSLADSGIQGLQYIKVVSATAQTGATVVTLHILLR